ncbi:hypothetical protein [Flavobacterium sp. C4GT6]|uniref:hypothetical protein n=1 Tax=Flavobacterium sp. C4GT6 TaxID=3103818 RepID=UPI002ED3DCF9
MKNLLKIFCLAAIVASCDDVEPTVFNGEDPSNATLLSFSSDVYSLPVERDANGITTITFTSSTLSSSDRVFNIEVIAGTANAATYNVPASVTIPAGGYVGTMDITGQDNNLVDEEIKDFTIRIPDSNFGNESLGFTEAQIRVYEVCPLLSEFTGSYTASATESMFTDPVIFDDSNVTLSVGANAYERVFDINPYPGYVGSSRTVKINFQCDYLNLGGTVRTGLRCNDDGDKQFTWGPVDTGDRAPYNTEDDSVINVNFIENTTSACGYGPNQSSFTLTKN